MSELLLLLILALIFIFTPDTYIGSKYRLSVYLICNNRYRYRPWKTHIGRPLDWMHVLWICMLLTSLGCVLWGGRLWCGRASDLEKLKAILCNGWAHGDGSSSPLTHFHEDPAWRSASIGTFICFRTLQHKTSLESLGILVCHCMGQNYTLLFYAKNHSDIKLRSWSMSIFSTINVSKLNFWLVICIAKNNFKDDFLNILIFLHAQIPDFQILSKQSIHQWKYDLFSFQMIHKSQFRKIYPYYWDFFFYPYQFLFFYLLWIFFISVFFFLSIIYFFFSLWFFCFFLTLIHFRFF